MFSPRSNIQCRMPPLIDYRNVTVMRRGRRILDSIDLRVEHGENIAILGPNGSGKSSLIRTITREYRPWSGEENVCRVMGKDVWDIFELRRTMGIVSMELQEGFLRNITGTEVVLSGFFSSIGINRSQEVTGEMWEKALDIIGYLDCLHLSERRYDTISMGEMRRLLIGRALVSDPDTLILDEPMNSLDIKARASFKSTLQGIAEDGRGIVLVTHDLQDIIPAISRVIMLKGGKVLVDARKEEALTEENLTELFDIEVSIIRNDGHYAAMASEDKSH
jgi:iron complex transport system ATP-binding protein